MSVTKLLTLIPRYSAQSSLLHKNALLQSNKPLSLVNFNQQTRIYCRAKTVEDAQKSDVPLSSAQKLKKAVAEYGTTVIVFHVGISLISLGTSYLLISSGLDVEKLLVTLKLNEYIGGNNLLVSNASTFAIAYAVHKVFAPVRITITLGSVPFIVRYLRNKGILKK